MVDEKPKERVKAENDDHIHLKVVGKDGSVVQFKRHTPLGKLMKACCERQASCQRAGFPGEGHISERVWWCVLGGELSELSETLIDECCLYYLFI
uniref:Rad60/SUMO-like domain-containing protein n=1 Tax=Moschus moschiferus TaxID=68415 RepID=A0A8C6CM07_MOSMO